MTRRLSILPLALAAVLGLIGGQVILHAQSNETSPPTAPATRASLRDWQFPGMQAQSDNSSQQVAMVTGRAIGDYTEVLAFYAKKMGANGYDPKQVAVFQPEGHSVLATMGMNSDDGAGFCYSDAQTLHTTLCRRFAHESVTVCLSEDKQSRQIHIALTDTTF